MEGFVRKKEFTMGSFCAISTYDCFANRVEIRSFGRECYERIMSPERLPSARMS